MRSVRTATCTEDEPVSVSCFAYCLLAVVLMKATWYSLLWMSLSFLLAFKLSPDLGLSVVGRSTE